MEEEKDNFIVTATEEFLNDSEAFELSTKLSSSGILVSAIASPFLKWSSNKQDFSIMGANVTSEQVREGIHELKNKTK